MSNVLIVDDAAIDRKYICSLLKYFGHHLFEAEDGSQGIKVLNQKKNIINLIITDILMPNIDGYEFVQKLKNDSTLKEIPIIFYTATYRKHEAQVLADDLGVNYVISKPADPQEILNVVNNSLGLSAQKIGANDELEKIISLQITAKSMPVDFKKIEEEFNHSFQEIDFIRESAYNLEHNKLLSIYKLLNTSYTQSRDISKKLFILLELLIDPLAANDIDILLHMFCVGAAKIVDAQYAVAGIFNSQGQICYFKTSKEEDNNTCSNQKDIISAAQPFISEILHKKCSFFENQLPKGKAKLIPCSLIEPTSFLAAPILTTNQVYGFIYFLNKNNNEFTLEDSRLIDVLSSKVGILYENTEFHKLIQSNSAKLQIEIARRIEAQMTLSKSEKLFRQFAENIDDVFFQVSPDLSKVIYTSPAYEKTWGRPLENLKKDPMDWLVPVLEEDKERVSEKFKNMQKNLKPINTKYRLRHSDGTIHHIYLKSSCVLDDKGNLISIIGIASDITKFVLKEKRLEVKKQLSRILKKGQSLNQIAPALLEFIVHRYECDYCELWLVDRVDLVLRNVDVLYKQNKKYEEFFSISKDMSFKKGEGFPGKVWEEENVTTIGNFSAYPHFVRFPYATKAGFKYALGFPLKFQNNVLGIINFFDSKNLLQTQEENKVIEMMGKQIGEFLNQKYSQEQITHFAKHDKLTGLMNKSAVDDLLKIKFSNQHEDYLPVLVFGIDRFKLINEGFGYDIGDQIICIFSKRLQKSNNAHRIPFRLSGGKFGIVVLDIKDKDALDKYAFELLELFKLPFNILDNQLQLTISIGISIYPQYGNTCINIIKNAESALRLAKTQADNHIRYFSPDVPQKISKKLILENDLRIALEKEQFVLFYQPKVNIKTNTVTGVEALVRWLHPEKGIIPPLEFISLAEESNLIVPIGDWVLTNACMTLKKLSAQYPKLTIAVNISIRQFNESNFIQKLEKVINTHLINAGQLDLEITESLFMNNLKQFEDQFNYIKRTIGVKFSLDDFGTGYSSLLYLSQLKIDNLKIDQSFIRMIPESKYHMAIVKTIISMAKALEIKTIAEGVETKEQWDFLLQEGCDEIQGYYFCRPIPLHQLIKFISKNSIVKEEIYHL